MHGENVVQMTNCNNSSQWRKSEADRGGTHLFFFSVHCHPRESRKSRNVDERGWGWGWGRWDSYTFFPTQHTFFPTQHFLLNFPDTGHAGTHRTPQTFLTRNKKVHNVREHVKRVLIVVS